MIFFINLQIISQGNTFFVSLIIVHFTLFFFQFRNQVFASLLGLETDFVSFFDLYEYFALPFDFIFIYIFLRYLTDKTSIVLHCFHFDSKVLID